MIHRLRLWCCLLFGPSDEEVRLRQYAESLQRQLRDMESRLRIADGTYIKLWNERKKLQADLDAVRVGVKEGDR